MYIPVAERYHDGEGIPRLLVGTTAIEIDLTPYRAEGFYIRNEHATQDVYFQMNSEADTASGILVKAGEVYPWPVARGKLSLVASGASTTVHLTLMRGA